MKNTSVSRRSAVLMNRACWQAAAPCCMYSQQGGRVFTLRQVMGGLVGGGQHYTWIYSNLFTSRLVLLAKKCGFLRQTSAVVIIIIPGQCFGVLWGLHHHLSPLSPASDRRVIVIAAHRCLCSFSVGKCFGDSCSFASRRYF